MKKLIGLLPFLICSAAYADTAICSNVDGSNFMDFNGIASGCGLSGAWGTAFMPAISISGNVIGIGANTSFDTSQMALGDTINMKVFFDDSFLFPAAGQGDHYIISGTSAPNIANQVISWLGDGTPNMDFECLIYTCSFTGTADANSITGIRTAYTLVNGNITQFDAPMERDGQFGIQLERVDAFGNPDPFTEYPSTGFGDPMQRWGFLERNNITPEPASWLLMGAGLMSLVLVSRRYPRMFGIRTDCQN